MVTGNSLTSKQSFFKLLAKVKERVREAGSVRNLALAASMMVQCAGFLGGSHGAD